MHNLTKVIYTSNDQHVEVGAARKERDHKDIMTAFHYLKDKSPFEGDDSLKNIANGMVANTGLDQRIHPRPFLKNSLRSSKF